MAAGGQKGYLQKAVLAMIWLHLNDCFNFHSQMGKSHYLCSLSLSLFSHSIFLSVSCSLPLRPSRSVSLLLFSLYPFLSIPSPYLSVFFSLSLRSSFCFLAFFPLTLALFFRLPFLAPFFFPSSFPTFDVMHSHACVPNTGTNKDCSLIRCVIRC